VRCALRCDYCTGTLRAVDCSVWCGASLCFFFQAEDGIRDFHVTGVQTCALPISLIASIIANFLRRTPTTNVACCSPPNAPESIRSEERRVGKERRSRWSPDH